MTLEELEKKLTELDDLRTELNKRIVELKAQDDEKPKPPHPRWKPERDEHYYTIDIGGACAGWETWDSDNLDGDIYSLGFVFKTEAEAEFAIERLKVIAEMREWTGEWNAPYLLLCGIAHGNVYVHWTTNANGALKFQTEEDAKNCIKAVGEDRIKKYYFMIPEDEADDD